MKRARWVGIALAAAAVAGSPTVMTAPAHAAQPAGPAHAAQPAGTARTAQIKVADTQCQTLYALYVSNLNLYRATGNYTYYIVARRYLNAWAALCV